MNYRLSIFTAILCIYSLAIPSDSSRPTILWSPAGAAISGAVAYNLRAHQESDRAALTHIKEHKERSTDSASQAVLTLEAFDAIISSGSQDRFFSLRSDLVEQLKQRQLDHANEMKRITEVLTQSQQAHERLQTSHSAVLAQIKPLQRELAYLRTAAVNTLEDFYAIKAPQDQERLFVLSSATVRGIRQILLDRASEVHLLKLDLKQSSDENATLVKQLHQSYLSHDNLLTLYNAKLAEINKLQQQLRSLESAATPDKEAQAANPATVTATQARQKRRERSEAMVPPAENHVLTQPATASTTEWLSSVD